MHCRGVNSESPEEVCHFLRLPKPLLVEVRDHVPEEERTSCCVLVCRELSAAAARRSLIVSISDAATASNTAERVHAQLELRGQYQQTLHVSSTPFLGGFNLSTCKPLFRLPCSSIPSLSSLTLDGVEIMLLTDPPAGADSSAGPAQQFFPVLHHVHPVLQI